MRFAKAIAAVLSVSSLFLGVVSAEESSTTSNDPEVLATAAFPEDNAFNQIVNGQKNTIFVSVENKSGQNVTLLSVAGSLNHPDTNKLIKNLTPAKFDLQLVEDLKLQVPYIFYSEYKPGEHRLNVWLEHSVDGKTYKVDAYESIVTVVEPDFSLFDIKLLLTYLIVAGILGGTGYLVFQPYFPQQKKKSKKAPTESLNSPASATAVGAGVYQEEWIPEHHLKKSKSAKRAGFTSGTSGDELSGAEASGTESKKRKGKKN
ncbi:hypothetical protein FA15DRAFT_666652 [Coprinopsis marcescibilis]|uniref:Uncharacterized protein n=1 Tax=Coprinopsis marcescibilis TaxID=230819 RepID=A0A5C3L2V2_COPMA|nr:hypothetical protein FA15DRAFT_666652 [Coprinopsis marcescibilis]